MTKLDTLLTTIPNNTMQVKDLPLGIIRVSGKDAKTFLQGQLTCDLNDVSPSQSRLGAHCNPKGRIISAFRILQWADTYLLIMPLSIIPIAIKHLQKYGAFSKVSIDDVSQAWHMLGIVGGQATTYLQQHYKVPTTIDTVTNQDNSIIVSLPGYVERYLVLAIDEVNQAIDNLPMAPATLWQYVDMQAGIPTILPATSEQFTPHDVNYPLINGVSFTKGCYTGQEIVARMQHLGKIKTKMVLIQLSQAPLPQPGAIIKTNDSPSAQGYVVNSIALTKDKQLVLVSVQEKLLQTPQWHIDNQVYQSWELRK